MFRIEITDPQLIDNKTLVLTAKFLLQLAGHDAEVVAPRPKVTPAVVSMAEELGEPVVDDNETDTRGHVWDSRIHSRTRSKNADGTWKLARNVNPALVAQVLKATPQLGKMSDVPTPVAIKGVTHSAEEYEALPASKASAVFGSVAPPPVVPVPAPAPVAAPIPMEPENDFPALVSAVSDYIRVGELNNQKVIDVVKEFGMFSIIQLQEQPHLIPQVLSRMEAVAKETRK